MPGRVPERDRPPVRPPPGPIPRGSGPSRQRTASRRSRTPCSNPSRGWGRSGTRGSGGRRSRCHASSSPRRSKRARPCSPTSGRHCSPGCSVRCGRSCSSRSSSGGRPACSSTTTSSSGPATCCATVPTVRRAVQRRYRHVLVDEFQDTDPLQVELAVLVATRVRRRSAARCLGRAGRRSPGDCSSWAIPSSRSTGSGGPTSSSTHASASASVDDLLGLVTNWRSRRRSSTPSTTPSAPGSRTQAAAARRHGTDLVAGRAGSERRREDPPAPSPCLAVRCPGPRRWRERSAPLDAVAAIGLAEAQRWPVRDPAHRRVGGRRARRHRRAPPHPHRVAGAGAGLRGGGHPVPRREPVARVGHAGGA